jgi:hypothetical protein
MADFVLMECWAELQNIGALLHGNIYGNVKSDMLLEVPI